VSQQQLPLGQEASGPVEVAPGAFWVRGWLDDHAQLGLADAFRQWAEPPAGLRRPRMPNGAPFSTRAVCLGWHWYPYCYSRTCDDNDGAPVKEFPPLLERLGAAACTATGFAPVAYDAAIVNLYEPGAKLGLHQDKIEGAEVIRAGSPVVTVSLGDTCVFRFGNTRRPSRPYQDVQLASGDLFVFGGPSRLAYHGVPKVYGGTAPPALGLAGRVSVTLRQSGQAG
jgi:DNA oxidative demethylase